MSIQVNFFDCGGIAIGAYIPHVIADGCSYFSFVTSWATISRGDNITMNPNFISSSLFPPMQNFEYGRPQVEFEKEALVTRRFVFFGSQIKTMLAKARLDDHQDMCELTRVEIVSAFIWKLATRDKPRKQHVASHMVNLRSRMVPREQDYTFGNLIGLGYAVSCHAESNSLAILARNVREGIKIIDHEYIQKIRGEEGYAMIMTLLRKMDELMGNKDVELFRFSSWCRFPVYEADFGMGKPVWASIASVNIKNSAFFIDSKCEDGIEAWVTMAREDMTRFQVAFEEAN